MIAKRKDNVVARHLDDEAVLVPIRNDANTRLAVHALGPVAAFVWSALDGQRDMDAIADMVSAEFEVDVVTAAADVMAFVRQLDAAGLVELA